MQTKILRIFLGLVVRHKKQEKYATRSENAHAARTLAGYTKVYYMGEGAYITRDLLQGREGGECEGIEGVVVLDGCVDLLDHV
jgi:hypothetical protein